MKKILHILLFIPTLSLGQIVPERNIPDSTGRMVNIIRIDSLNDKPIEYYLNHYGIDYFSKEFYQGNFRVSDDAATFSLMDSILTDNDNTRPFYLFNFCRIIEMSDGALSEGAAEYCREFILKHPCEYLKICSDKDYKTIRFQWAGFIGFSLYNIDNYKKLVTEIEMHKCVSNSLIWEQTKHEIYDNLENK